MKNETQHRLREAGNKARWWTAERDRLIHSAVTAEHASLREVAAAVGLSHTAVKFITDGRDQHPSRTATSD